MATHSYILAWEIPWTEEPGGLQSMKLQRVGHNWATEHAYIFRTLALKLGCTLESLGSLKKLQLVAGSHPLMFWVHQCGEWPWRWNFLKSPRWFYFLFLFYFFSFIFISWWLITLQYYSGFCHTLTWISHGFTCIPHPDPPSHLPLYPIPMGLPSAPGPSTCLMYPTSQVILKYGQVWKILLWNHAKF